LYVRVTALDAYATRRKETKRNNLNIKITRINPRKNELFQ
jgi:hypothetical protein